MSSPIDPSAHGIASSETDLQSRRELVARACRVLAVEGLVDGVLGHVSMRVGTDRMLVRCRGPEEKGLRYTRPEDVRLVDFDGRGDDLVEGYSTPNELPIHSEVMRARPEVNAVVHAHPFAVLVAGIAGVPLRPIFGAYDMPAMRMAAAGVPVYPRSVLVRRPELAKEMLAAMGDKSVCIMRGHGITVAAGGVESAVVKARNLNVLASVSLAVAQAGGHPEDVTPEDMVELPDLGPELDSTSLWRYLVARAEHEAR